jgi:hypothetical protein
LLIFCLLLREPRQRSAGPGSPHISPFSHVPPPDPVQAGEPNAGSRPGGRGSVCPGRTGGQQPDLGRQRGPRCRARRADVPAGCRWLFGA